MTDYTALCVLGQLGFCLVGELRRGVLYVRLLCSDDWHAKEAPCEK